MTTQKDIQRMIELIDQGSAAGDPAEDIVRRIVRQMPHVTADDIAQVALVRAEELELDAGVQMAQAEASLQIANIIRETQQREGNAQLNTEEARFLVLMRAQDGDKRAAELLDKLNKALLVVDLGE